ncbi:hypothetical protein COL5a_007255 [Colletotrichum fioriniae]|uniref:uncharacterized protein n=1 Tax=Colletotrichum fioriniae TaxID=710243 RepID=UPI002301F479|nr:uncharacterized protein COL516b_005200 [Colletotrichum fioriniae]KAJ0305505.1 hypothetical protein COL516b_005200 [Colletotrichum fioriniae]KAJ0325747.1 hypothetical protein COL5a_007255 [Colletotrichum fioriniae]KAJ3938693.1 hypothetical protein N0V96_011424 [Colletotrichum fioriniae]
MSPVRQGRKIALVGASGNLGQHTLTALLSHGIHDITIIVRNESTSQFPDKITVNRVAFDDEAALTSVLKGQEVLILQLGIPAVGLSDVLIRAAAKANVPYILPTEFGSDPEGKLIEELPEIADKGKYRELIEKLGVGSWIGVITNPWYDFCLPVGDVLGVNAKTLKATLWNGGNTKMNYTTLARAGAVTAAVVAMPDEELARYRNKCFYTTSFHVTQREVLNSVMLATGTCESDWDIREESVDEVIERANAMSGDDAHAVVLAKFFPLHYKEGEGGDFNSKTEDLSRFDLSKENFHAVTKDVVLRILSL